MYVKSIVYENPTHLVKSLVTRTLDAQVDHGVGQGATHIEL